MPDASAGVDHEAVIKGRLSLSEVGYLRYPKSVPPFLAAVSVSNCVFLGSAAAIG